MPVERRRFCRMVCRAMRYQGEQRLRDREIGVGRFRARTDIIRDARPTGSEVPGT